MSDQPLYWEDGNGLPEITGIIDITTPTHNNAGYVFTKWKNAHENISVVNSLNKTTNHEDRRKNQKNKSQFFIPIDFSLLSFFLSD